MAQKVCFQQTFDNMNLSRGWWGLVMLRKKFQTQLMPGDRHKSQLKLRGKVSRKYPAQGGQCAAQLSAKVPHCSTGGQILISLTPIWARSNSSNFQRVTAT